MVMVQDRQERTYAYVRYMWVTTFAEKATNTLPCTIIIEEINDHNISLEAKLKK